MPSARVGQVVRQLVVQPIPQLPVHDERLQFPAQGLQVLEGDARTSSQELHRGRLQVTEPRIVLPSIGLEVLLHCNHELRLSLALITNRVSCSSNSLRSLPEPWGDGKQVGVDGGEERRYPRS